MKARIFHPRSTKPVVVLIGSRIWEDSKTIENHLTEIQPVLVIDGNTRGAEAIASDWCAKTGTLNLRMPAQPAHYHDKALHTRNLLILQVATMLAHSLNTGIIVLAYPWGDSPGTRNMMRQATEYGLETRVTESTWEPKT